MSLRETTCFLCYVDNGKHTQPHFVYSSDPGALERLRQNYARVDVSANLFPSRCKIIESRYAVTATRNGRQIPTFYLDADVQGIMDTEHAKRIAVDIVGEDADVCVCPV